MNIRTDMQLESHFVKIGKKHWADFDKYSEGKIREYIKRTSPELLSSKRKRILDLGAGPGHYSYFLKNNGHDTFGIDRAIKDETTACYKYLSKKYDLSHAFGGVEEFVGIKNFGFEEQFDVINMRGAFSAIIDTLAKNNIGADSFFERLNNSLKDSNSYVIFCLNRGRLDVSLNSLECQTTLKIQKIGELTYKGFLKGSSQEDVLAEAG